MTCMETRDLFSALADDALTPDERAALDAHLAGCAECRRELATFARTVKMVRAMDPAHAPAGFVDRVLAAAQPEPWSRRVVRRVFRPWPALPLSAAALLVIGGLAVLLFRASPEQQRFARQQYESTDRAQPAPGRPATRASEPVRPAESARPTEPAPTATPAPSGQRDALSAAPAKQDATAKQNTGRPPAAEPRATPAPAATAPRETSAPPATSAPPSASAPPAPERARPQATAQPPAAKRADASSTRETPPPAAPPAAAMADKVAPPPADRDEQRAKGRSRDEAKDQAKDERDRAGVSIAKLQQPAPQIAPLSRTGPTTGIPAAPPDVTAQLRTADVRGAERSLIQLAARVGGRQTGRRIDGGRVVVELAVPGDAYADFVRRAAALGAVAIEHQAFERPVLAVAVTISD